LQKQYKAIIKARYLYTFSISSSFCFISPKTLLCFRIRVRVRIRAGVSGNTFLVKHIFNQV